MKGKACLRKPSISLGVRLLIEEVVRIEPQKARYDVTKLNLTILLLSLWYIDIDLSIQAMSLTLYMI